jgi:hypothetical protein
LCKEGEVFECAVEGATGALADDCSRGPIELDVETIFVQVWNGTRDSAFAETIVVDGCDENRALDIAVVRGTDRFPNNGLEPLSELLRRSFDGTRVIGRKSNNMRRQASLTMAIAWDRGVSQPPLGAILGGGEGQKRENQSRPTHGAAILSSETTPMQAFGDSVL